MLPTAVDTAFVAKPLVLGILPSISVILVLKSVFLTRLLLSGVLFSSSVLSVSYVFKTNALVSILFTLEVNLSWTVFLTTSFFYYIT